jgi:alanyl-tRNA synthetase
MIGSDGQRHPITDAWTGVVHGETGELVLGEDARALGRTGDEWRSVVVHVIGGSSPNSGELVGIEVDADRRHRLSAAHTAAHLSAFALNRAAKDYWSKAGAALDSLGNPDFDKEVIVSALLSEQASVDTYRVGRTVRKKGFELDRFSAALPSIIPAINDILRGWLSAPGSVSLSHVPSTLDTRRLWQCTLDGMDASMYCAGTHVASLAELAEVTVSIEAIEGGVIMHTSVIGI